MLLPVPNLTDAGIGETDVQEVLTSLLNDVGECRDRFLARVGRHDFANGTGAQFIRAVRSVRDVDGETDVLADWERAGLGRLRVLGEVKLAAQFMPRQGARYRARAARTMAQGAADHVTTVLIAPATYSAGGHAEARRFDVSIALEEILAWATASGAPGSALLRDALDRLAGGRPLGAKGLFPALHTALDAEIARRHLPFYVDNASTDWVFADGPSFGTGVRLRYRIKKGHAEVRLRREYRGDHALPGVKRPAYIRRVPANSETNYRHAGLRVTAATCAGNPTSADVEAIASALTDLADWWARRGPDAAQAATAAPVA